MRSVRLKATFLSISLGLGVTTGWAQSGPQLRHEYVRPEVFKQFDPRSTSSIEHSDGDMPKAARRDGERLEAPGDGADAASFGPTGIIRPSEARPDLNTAADRSLTYHMVFNPTVAPLRRNVVFDQIEADYRLVISPGPRRPLPISPQVAAPGRELFWGDLKIDAKDGAAVPIPSVSPEMRILGVWAEPEVTVEFEKDGADNFYARVAGTGSTRLKILVDAGADYFYAPVSGDVKLSIMAGQEATELNRRTRAAGLEVLKVIGVSRDAPFDQGVGRIVGWFRAFEGGPPPKQVSNDVYTTLALGKVGVCRHRAFAFLITARAAGVPTRYVQNEAHAFVEIKGPDGRWRRIDLGGDAPDISITGDNPSRRLHRPTPDSFPKPKSFTEQYSNALTAGGGSDKVVNGPSPLGGEPKKGPSSAHVAEVPYPRLQLREGEPAVKGAVARIVLDLDGTRAVFRGEPAFEVTGSVVADDGEAPIEGLRVQLYAVPTGGGTPLPVGRATSTDSSGRFTAPLSLPSTLELGRYTLAAVSKANGKWAAARSNAKK